MHTFLQKKVIAAGGSKKQVALMRFGGKRKVGDVKIALIRQSIAMVCRLIFSIKPWSSTGMPNACPAATNIVFSFWH